MSRIMRAKGWSQKRLALEVGVDSSTVSRWKSGVREPRLADLIKIADALEVSLDELVGREFPPRED